MKEKIYKFIKNLGNVIAVFLMLSPIIIIREYNKMSEPYFWFICSILYDIYMYSIIIKSNFIKGAKERYFKYVKNVDTTLPALKLTDKEKIDNIEKFIEDIFDELEK